MMDHWEAFRAATVCRTCRYFEPAKQECRFNAPAPSKGGGRLFPSVDPLDWCGRHGRLPRDEEARRTEEVIR